jgi:NAD(P)-dependent dehydrogenase (short-subunit alcohol dehydrogenase family)
VTVQFKAPEPSRWRRISDASRTWSGSAEREIQEFGGFDTWINNAGVAIFGTVEQIPLEDYRGHSARALPARVHRKRASVSRAGKKEKYASVAKPLPASIRVGPV